MMNKLTQKALIAGIIGNALEWYDFALYGHFSVFIGETFFPKEEEGLAVLAALAVFSVSFFMRPIGALIFSAIGDRFGRKKALSLSIMGMALPTAAIGLLPPFENIGITATILLVILRLLQGLALGGEMGGAVTYVLEHTPKRRIGLASSLIQASTCLGLLTGTLLSSGLSLILSEADFTLWGWRIPFILGLAAAWLGLKIRQKMPESLLYEIAKTEDRLIHNPIGTIIKRYKRRVLLGVAVLTPMTCGFFFAFVYFNSFMISSLHFEATRALLTTTLGLTLSLATTLVGGTHADRFGYKSVLVVGALCLLVLSYPLTLGMSGFFGDTPILFTFLTFSVLLGLYTSAAFAAVTGLFGTEVRYTGVSIAINLASPIFGSTAPLLIAFLLRRLGVDHAFGLFGAYLAMLFIIALIAIRSLDHRAFHQWGGGKEAEG